MYDKVMEAQCGRAASQARNRQGYVVLKPGQTATEEIRTFCRQNLAPTKCPPP